MKSPAERYTARLSSEDAPIVRILDEAYETIITIGAWSSCEHELKDLAIEFVEKVKAHYRSQVEEQDT